MCILDSRKVYVCNDRAVWRLVWPDPTRRGEEYEMIKKY